MEATEVSFMGLCSPALAVTPVGVPSVKFFCLLCVTMTMIRRSALLRQLASIVGSLIFLVFPDASKGDTRGLG